MKPSFRARMVAAIGLPIATALLCVFLGFCLGRGLAPHEVREVTRWQTRTEFRVLKVRVVERQEAKRVVVYRDRVTTPDGTVHEKEVEASATETHVRDASREEARGVEIREVERRVEVTRPAPQWRAALFAGVDLRSVRLVPPEGDLYVGGQLERRIAGPFSVGVWAFQRGPVGLSLSVTW